MKRVDLHIHSTASDGTWTAREAVEAAINCGLGIMAITDHDSVDNVAEAMKIAKAEGIGYIPGSEICSTKDGYSMHILGYGIDVENKELRELLAYNTGLLRQKDDDTIKLLIEKGWQLDFEEFLKYDFDRRRGGWKSLAYMEDKGFCKGVEEFFSKIFTAENNLGFPIFPSVKEVCDIIHRAGGVAICAHAASSFHGPGLEKVLEELAEEPLDGFECYHSGHTQKDAEQLAEYCKKRGLLISGGSDCHGTFVKNRALGKPEVYESDLYLPGLL